MGIAPTERLKFGRQMAAVAGKTESVSCSLLMEVNEFGGHGGSVQHGYDLVGGRRVGEQLGKEQQKSWRMRIFEAPTWRQARGLTRAVMCETEEILASSRHSGTLLVEGQVAVDMRVVCPHGVKEDTSETSQDGPSDEMGSHARV